jgi:hypothetical protein
VNTGSSTSTVWLARWLHVIETSTARAVEGTRDWQASGGEVERMCWLHASYHWQIPR